MHTTTLYHGTLAPHGAIFRFLSLCGENREIAIYVARGTARGADGAPETALWRYQHCVDEHAFEEMLRRRSVVRLELGACYSVSPRLLRTLSLQARAETRDLLFDVDVDAYDASATEGAVASSVITHGPNNNFGVINSRNPASSFAGSAVKRAALAW